MLTNGAAVAKECLRATDIIVRYGGEEFIICLPNTHLAAASQIANRIRVRISDSFIRNHGNEIRVTSSFGFSNAELYTGEDRHSIHSLMREADKALYIAKKMEETVFESLVW